MPRPSLVAGLIAGSLAALGGGITPLSNVTAGRTSVVALPPDHTRVAVPLPPDPDADRLPVCHDRRELRTGIASWYGGPMFHQTANGEPFQLDKMAAASRTLPFNTHVR